MMEIRINREIREYTESLFFGLSLRQFVLSVLGCGAAVGTYFLLKPVLGMETASWACMLAALPFMLVGFVRYNRMTMERFLLAFVKSEILMPKRLLFRQTNLYYRALKLRIDEKEKEAMKGKRNKRVKKLLKQRRVRGERREGTWSKQ